jgi:hypothetical protein
MAAAAAILVPDASATPVRADAPRLTPGSYSSPSGLTFWVDQSGTKVQDVLVLAGLTESSFGCSPLLLHMAGTPKTELSLPAAGGIAASVKQKEYWSALRVSSTYALSLNPLASRTGASGTYNVTVSWKASGVKHTCVSGSVAWSASRDAQPSTQAPDPRPGRYRTATQSALSFYVSANGKKLQDAVAGIFPYCGPGIGFSTRYTIDGATIKPDGSFSQTKKVAGVNGSTFTYTISGHVHGLDATGVPRIAGTYAAEVALLDGRVCATGTLAFPVARREVSQADDQTPSIQPGTYILDVPGYAGVLSFTVSADRKRIENVAGRLGIPCGGSVGMPDDFRIASIVIARDGSFAGTATHGGFAGSWPAHFSYTFSGHFHGTDGAGHARVAGVLTDVIDVDYPTPYTCRTDPVIEFAGTH